MFSVYISASFIYNSPKIYSLYTQMYTARIHCLPTSIRYISTLDSINIPVINK